MEPDSRLPKCLSQSLGYALGVAARELRKRLDAAFATARELKKHTDAVFASFGISGQSFSVLAAANGRKPKTQIQIGACLGLDRPRITGHMNDLVTAGLIGRTRHPSDRRAMLVTITPKGKRALAEGQKIITETEWEFFRSLSDRDRDREYLKRLLSLLTG